MDDAPTTLTRHDVETRHWFAPHMQKLVLSLLEERDAAVRERDCLWATRDFWPLHLRGAIERGDVSECQADAQHSKEFFIDVMRERDAAIRDEHSAVERGNRLAAEVAQLRVVLEIFETATWDRLYAKGPISREYAQNVAAQVKAALDATVDSAQWLAEHDAKVKAQWDAEFIAAWDAEHREEDDEPEADDAARIEELERASYAMRRCLIDWLETPFFESEAAWKSWVAEFRPRVDQAVGRMPPTQPQTSDAARVESLSAALRRVLDISEGYSFVRDNGHSGTWREARAALDGGKA